MLDIETLIRRISQDISSVLRVALPARVISYDYKTQRVDVDIDIKELYSDGRELDYPVISGVPVIFPISGGASITMPINAGDSCLILFADRDITNWLLGGRSVKPDSRRMHDINDAIAIMGLRAFTDKPFAENSSDLLVSYSGSKVRLRPEGNVDIISTNSLNVETGDVVINCNHSTINARSQVKVNCNDAIIKAVNKINVECKDATIKASNIVDIKCENSSVIANNNVNIKCKDGYIDCSKTLNILSKEIKIKAGKNLHLECVHANITASKDITITAGKNINITSKTLTHTGKFIVTGDVEISGTAKVAGMMTTQDGITNSGANLVSNNIVLETHTHSYNEPVVGSEPTAAIPSITGEPT